MNLGKLKMRLKKNSFEKKSKFLLSRDLRKLLRWKEVKVLRLLEFNKFYLCSSNF